MPYDPVALFDSASTAIATEDWAALVALCDATSVKVLAERLRSPYLQEKPPRTLTVDEYVKHNPDMPREVAEYQASLHRKHSAPEYNFRHDFPSVESIPLLLAMSPGEVVAAWLYGHSPRAQIEHQAAEGYVSRRAADQALQKLGSEWSYVLLGVVADGETIAHVIFRGDYSIDLSQADESTDPDEAALQRDLLGKSHPQILTCRRAPDGNWGIVADYGMFGLGSSMFYIDEHAENDDAVEPER